MSLDVGDSRQRRCKARRWELCPLGRIIMPSMAKLWRMLWMYVLGAPLWLLAYLVSVVDRRPYTCGERWNDEWMDSFVPGQDGWNPTDRPDGDDDGEPDIDLDVLDGAVCFGASPCNRRLGDPIRAPPARKPPIVTPTPACTIKTDKNAGVEES